MMKQATLTALRAILESDPPRTGADHARLAEVLRAFRGDTPPDASEATARVLRWKDAADRVGITTKRLRDAFRTAGLEPVVLPGSKRAIGVRLADLATIIGEG
jgi:hypothetical protein